jgi:glutamate dehydrogenase (NADP+)
MKSNGPEETLAWLEARNLHQGEFLQAAREIVQDVWPLVEKNAAYRQGQIMQRLLEPDRVLSFRVTWETDDGKLAVNRGYRVQTSNALGPYKGGLRFHPSVNESILKFLGLEQTLKNSLTGLSLGSGKGGADFNPKHRSEAEIRRFCFAFMEELGGHIGAETDVPAGDIGVGPREIGFLFGQYKRMHGAFEGALTGKPDGFGGSALRPEATGYGVVHFAGCAMERADETLEGKHCAISGAGNVARFCAEKLIEIGAVVTSLSDSGGTLRVEDGLKDEHLHWLGSGGRLQELAQACGLSFRENEKPWSEPCDVAFPCATQNELDAEDAETLADGGCRWVVEGANMPCTEAAIETFRAADVIVCPGKAANAGGVAVSAFEMSQNAAFERWSRGAVEKRLRRIMTDIHKSCVAHLPDYSLPDYIRAANRAGFVRVADAMVAQGR